MSNPFNRVKGLRPGKSVFPLTHEVKFTADMGYLYPVCIEEVLPGDVFDIGNNTVVRAQPMVAPPLHEINCFTHYFWVPNRLLWPSVISGTPPVLTDGWELLATMGKDGTSTPTIPTWTPTATTVGSVWDFFGNPVGVTPDANHLPIALPLYAYNMIINEYYIDPKIQDRRALDDDTALALRCWEKDYFTSALTDQQLGTAPALPITGIINIDASSAVSGSSGTGVYINTTSDTVLGASNGANNADLQNALEKLSVDLSGATTFDVADLRLAIGVQRFMELNNRAGNRYSEQLYAHYGVKSQDSRLDRPEYIGGTRFPLIVSEVVQTSETNTTEQGNLAGHGIGIGNQYVGKFRATEHGWMIGLLSILPRPLYQQGIPRQYLRRSVYDYYWPELANLSEQAIERCELYATGTESQNETIFGYQGAYDEYRTRHSRVAGLIGTTYDYWHLSRQFSSAPSLNSTFLECDPRKDFLAAPSEPAFIISHGNVIRAIRPMPIQADPGYMDQVYGG